MARVHSSSLISSGFGDLVYATPRSHGGIDLYWHQGEDWSGPAIVLGTHNDVTDVSLIESGIGGSVNLHCVYREGTQLAHDWGERPPGIWHGPTWLPGDLVVTGAPAFIEGPNFEVHVLAPVEGGIAHWTGLGRTVIDSADPARPPFAIDWNAPVLFGDGVVSAVAVLRGSFENLEAVARVGASLVHYWHDSASAQWNGPFEVGSGVTGRHCWMEGPDGNYEVVAPMADSGLGRWTRDNAVDGFPWSGPERFGRGLVDHVAMAEGFELVVRVAGQLFEYTRTPDWSEPARVDADPPLPAAMGRTAVPFRAGMVGIHAALLRTGRVLLFGFGDQDETIAESRVVNTDTGAITTPSGVGHPGHGGMSTPHVFCSGHAFLADGRLLVTGGHHLDIKNLNTFDPSTSSWALAGTMAESRWYPTCCPLPGGRVVTVGGTGGLGGTNEPINNTLQIYDPATGVGPEIAVPSPFSRHFDAEHPLMDTYPLVLWLPSGKLFVHSRFATRFYDPGSNDWEATDLQTQYEFARTYPGQGNGVLLPLLPEEGYRARILLVGGCGDRFERIWWGVGATNTAEILDLGEAAPAWRFTGSMSSGRVMCDSVLLPDGKVLTVGGSSRGAALSGANPVFDAELFDPATETWRALIPMQVPRMYHSTALLLPDGRVLLAGKDGPLNPFPYHYPEHRIEIYSPPYLFQGARPVVSSAPAEITYGGSFVVRVNDPGAVASAVIMRPDTTTHSVHMDQRLVGLNISSQTATQLTLQAPPEPNIAPQGYYMLFLVSEQGVPSVARFVRLR